MEHGLKAAASQTLCFLAKQGTSTPLDLGGAILLHRVHPYFPLIYPSFISHYFPAVSYGSISLNSEWAQTQTSLQSVLQPEGTVLAHCSRRS